MGAEDTASDLLNVQSAFDLAADTYAIDAKPILATIDPRSTTDCRRDYPANDTLSLRVHQYVRLWFCGAWSQFRQYIKYCLGFHQCI